MKSGIFFRFFFLAAILAGMGFRPFVQTLEISFQQVVVDYNFDERITFEAHIQPLSILEEIESVEIVIYPEGASPIIETTGFDSTGYIRFNHEISDQGWAPFSTVLFKFHTTLQNGMEIDSDTFAFQYDDNRLDWKSVSSPPFIVYWHSTDNQLGQTILHTAVTGMQAARGYSGASLADSIRIFAYSDLDYLGSALKVDDLTLLAAHAAPERNVILLSALPGPGLQLELERQLPHEISHILLYKMSGEGFDSLPLWLVEGVATISEIYPNTDYQRILDAAASQGSLIPIESLCDSFPPDPTAAYLAYAQSGSFVNFLYKKYGVTGLDNLVLKYAEGVSCTAGIAAVFGKTLPELEYRWQQEVLGINSELLILQNLAPYLAIFLVLVLLPVAPYLVHLRSKKKA